MYVDGYTIVEGGIGRDATNGKIGMRNYLRKLDHVPLLSHFKPSTFNMTTLYPGVVQIRLRRELVFRIE
jgi:hypothetical protein